MGDTRAALVEAATRTFAEDGVLTASLVEVTRRAGQRNRGAVHYHFGSREALLGAVLEAIVRPAIELAETGPSGRDYLVIVGQLVEEYDRLDPTVRAALTAT